jgi:hypothetical protein
MAFRREVLAVVGGFDEVRWYRLADIEWRSGSRTPVSAARRARSGCQARASCGPPRPRADLTLKRNSTASDRWRDHWDLVLSGKPEHTTTMTTITTSTKAR